MRLNHIGVSVSDVFEAREFLEKYFGMKGIGKNNHKMTHLQDDGGLIPSENIVPVIRQDALNATIEEVLDAISSTLTLDELMEMNRRVEVDNEDPDLVARDWLDRHGFLDGP
jgi:glycine betaine/choline ABC-type transport system substrate-binding protein